MLLLLLWCAVLRSKRYALVNRGWVPASWKEDPRKLLEATPVGRTSEVTIMQPSETPNLGMPPNDLAAGKFHWVVQEELVRCVGGGRVGVCVASLLVMPCCHAFPCNESQIVLCGSELKVIMYVYQRITAHIPVLAVAHAALSLMLCYRVLSCLCPAAG